MPLLIPHHLKLDLLYLRQPFPLAGEDVVHLLMQVADFQFGLEVDPGDIVHEDIAAHHVICMSRIGDPEFPAVLNPSDERSTGPVAYRIGNGAWLQSLLTGREFLY